MPMNQNLVDYVLETIKLLWIPRTLVDEVNQTSVNFDQDEVNQIQETELDSAW